MNKYRSTIGTIGAVLLLSGAIIQITRLMWAPYLYLAGAILFAYTQITDDRGGIANPCRCHDVDMEPQRMGALPHHSRCIGTLYGVPHPARNGKGMKMKN